MPTAKLFHQDEEIDPDETILEDEVEGTQMINIANEVNVADNGQTNATEKTSPHRYSSPLPLRGGGAAPATNATTTTSQRQRLSKKARLKQLAEQMDSDSSDEELSERAFLEGLARRQREQMERMESQTCHRHDGSGSSPNNGDSSRQRCRTNDGGWMDESTILTAPMDNRTMDLSGRDATFLNDDSAILDHRTAARGNATAGLEDPPRDSTMEDEFDETQGWEREILDEDTTIMGTSENDSFASGNKGGGANPKRQEQNNEQQQRHRQKPNKTVPQMTSFSQRKLQQQRQSLQKHGWQIQAYHSSLTELISSFQTHSPSEMASCHMARKRSFEAASRALARLAIASRSDAVEDANPPSPRSLPGFVSVMNVHGKTTEEETGMRDVFVGRSVHGRSGRTVCLDVDLESLTFRAVEFAAGVCREGTCENMSRGLVEAALEFLATGFACLDCDLVYSMLLLSVEDADREKTTLFDLLLKLAPREYEEGSGSNLASLAFLALSRGLEAANFVARYATSLDPAGCCEAYASPRTIISNLDSNRIDEGGVGFLSALGKDLGLRLEDNGGIRVGHLCEIARFAYNSVLDFNPMISSCDSQSYDDTSSKSRGNERGGNRNNSLCIDTDVGNREEFQCRQPSVVKDRMYAAHVEFLSTMIQLGVVSGWLSSDSDEAFEKLCQKLFLVIETRSRLCRSTNQTKSDAHGDSETVCSASLSLLLLSLPKHQEQTTSNPMSFRQMGGSCGTTSDILESPLVKRMVELGLSLSCETGQNESTSPTKTCAITSVLYVTSDIVMVGGASLISNSFDQQLRQFLIEAITRISQIEIEKEQKSGTQLEAVLTLILHLHNGCPLLVRQTLRNHFEQSASDSVGDDKATCFVGILLQLCAHPCFALSACASALCRTLLRGNPIDETPDALSDILRQALDNDFASSSIDIAFHSVAEMTNETYNTKSDRYLPRLCSICDTLSACLVSRDLQQTLAESLSSRVSNKSIKSVFVDMINVCRNRIDGADNLLLSSVLSMVYLLNQIISSDQDVNFQARLETIGLMVIETAISQDVSVDLTRRAIKHQKILQVNEKALALMFTRSWNTFRQYDTSLSNRVKDAEREIQELRNLVQAKENERAKLSRTLSDQRMAYEKRLALVRFESQSVAKKSAEIHVHERQRAEQHALKHERMYSEEKERRRSVEQQKRGMAEESQRLKHELSQVSSSISKLERALKHEIQEKEDYASALKASKRDLESTTQELEKSNNAAAELHTKLSSTEKTAIDLTATNKDLEATVEEVCEKLVNLSTIYQRKEAEMDKYKAELRSAVNAANKNCDTALSKYEAQRKEARSLKKELEITIKELNDLKAHKADVQRLKKTAPTQYINQLRKDPRVQAQSRKSRSGKENSFNGR